MAKIVKKLISSHTGRRYLSYLRSIPMPDLKGMPVAAKPMDYGTGGSFRLARRLAPASTTLTGVLWTFRNPHATRLAVVERVRLQLLQIGAPTAAIEDRFSLTRVTGYTAADTTGLAAITPAAGKQKLRGTAADSVVTVQESNLAAGISGGTRVADTNPLITGSVWIPIALQTASIQSLALVFDYGPASAHPLVLGTNEGFIITNDNALGTASGIALFFEAHWTEVDAF